MKKLRLNPEELRVDTFGVAPDLPQAHGTVEARWGRVGDDTQKPDCDLSGAQSCDYSFCGDDTCGTCDYNTYCGWSCVLVCDTVETAVNADLQ